MSEEKRYCYAEIGSDGICFNVFEAGTEIIKDTLIAIENYDVSVLGKKYTGGAWETVLPLHDEPTDSEVFQAQALSNQAEIAAKQSEMDETLAEILLNQIGG